MHSPAAADFVLLSIFVGALRDTYCGVLQSHVTVYEMNNVQLSCNTTSELPVEWRIKSKFQRTQIEAHHDSRRIYSTLGLLKMFSITGRYSVQVGNGFYNLTISNVNMSEAGEYICHEARALGNFSSTQLTVLVNVSALQNYVNLSVFDGDLDVHMPCRVGSEYRVIWMYIKSSEGPQIVIFNGADVDPMHASSYKVSRDRRTGYYNLTINHVQLNESGWFICMEYSRSIFIRTTRLTVLVNVSSFENPKTIWSSHGRDETLSCPSAPFNPVRWVYIESQHAPQQVIANGKMIEPGYETKVSVFVNETSGENKLVIHNAQLNESGWYVCIDDGASPHINPYFLNVLVEIASIPYHEHLSIVNGSNAILPCRASDGGSVRWFHGESDITPQYVIFDGSSVLPQYSDRVRALVNQTTGDFNLSISNVRMIDAGWYICIEINSHFVHLSLLEVHEDSQLSGLPLSTVILVAVIVGVSCLIGGLWLSYLLQRRRSDSNGRVSMRPLLRSEAEDEQETALRVDHIIPHDGKRHVSGITAIDDKLYVIRIPTKGQIQVYNKNTCQLDRSMEISDLNDADKDPWERALTSCAQRKRLYVSDKHTDTIYAVHIENRDTNWNWKVEPIMNKAEYAGPTGLSVNTEGNVIVTCYEDSTIRIYNPDEKNWLQTVNLLELKQLMTRPYHAVGVTTKELVVSHYGPKIGISLINLDTKQVMSSRVHISKSMPDSMPEEWFGLRYLARHSKGFVFTVDNTNKKDEILVFEEKNGRISRWPCRVQDSISAPWCLYLDESASRLYVGEKGKCRVIVIDIPSMTL